MDNFEILYWHWLVIGMVLIMLEIFLPSFMAFWFGLGALIVGLALWINPDLALSSQILIWAASSSVFTLAWFKFVRPLMRDRTKAGMAREALIGETGLVVKTPLGDQRGIVRFATPLLGNEEWPFLTTDTVAVGDRVDIVELSGNTLVVRKH